MNTQSPVFVVATPDADAEAQLFDYVSRLGGTVFRAIGRTTEWGEEASLVIIAHSHAPCVEILVRRYLRTTGEQAALVIDAAGTGYLIDGDGLPHVELGRAQWARGSERPSVSHTEVYVGAETVYLTFAGAV